MRKFSTKSIPPLISIFYAKEGFPWKNILSRLFVQNFLSHSTKKNRWKTLQYIKRFRVAKNFMPKKGISLNSVENSLSHSADKIRRRTLLCFERILVSKIFKQRRGEPSRFCRNFVIPPDRKNFARAPFCVSENFGREKYFMDKGDHNFRSKFLSHCTKIFHWKTLWCFTKKFFYRKFSCIGGGHHGFVETFCLTGPKR